MTSARHMITTRCYCSLQGCYQSPCLARKPCRGLDLFQVSCHGRCPIPTLFAIQLYTRVIQACASRSILAFLYSLQEWDYTLRPEHGFKARFLFPQVIACPRLAADFPNSNAHRNDDASRHCPIWACRICGKCGWRHPDQFDGLLDRSVPCPVHLAVAWSRA